eukprot:7332193-Lingulodinium_polyedra.AAC.1
MSTRAVSLQTKDDGASAGRAANGRRLASQPGRGLHKLRPGLAKLQDSHKRDRRAPMPHVVVGLPGGSRHG